jgi:hypothetical protein
MSLLLTCLKGEDIFSVADCEASAVGCMLDVQPVHVCGRSSVHTFSHSRSHKRANLREIRYGHVPQGPWHEHQLAPGHILVGKH